MKHRFTTSLRSQIGSQLSGQQQVKTAQRCKHQQARFCLRILGCAGYFIHRLLEKGRTINSDYYIALLVHLKEEIAKKRPQMKKKKVLFHQNNTPYHKFIATMAKLHELHFELLPHPPYSPDLTPSDNWQFANLKRMHQGKRFDSNEKVTSETVAYFEVKNKSFNKKGIELLGNRWNQCITQEEDYVDELSRILPKICCFIS